MMLQIFDFAAEACPKSHDAESKNNPEVSELSVQAQGS
jgi:hypothetical protein